MTADCPGLRVDPASGGTRRLQLLGKWQSYWTGLSGQTHQSAIRCLESGL